jgi:hypothetical protein
LNGCRGVLNYLPVNLFASIIGVLEAWSIPLNGVSGSITTKTAAVGSLPRSIARVVGLG